MEMVRVEWQGLLPPVTRTYNIKTNNGVGEVSMASQIPNVVYRVATVSRMPERRPCLLVNHEIGKHLRSYGCQKGIYG